MTTYYYIVVKPAGAKKALRYAGNGATTRLTIHANRYTLEQAQRLRDDLSKQNPDVTFMVRCRGFRIW